MENFSKKNPAFVLGLFETGLGVIRSLGREGIKVYGFDYKKDIAYYSKYVFPLICPDARNNEEGFINFLVSKAQNFDYKPVLYITSDDFLTAIINNLDEISNYFLINSLDKYLYEKIKNKFLQFNLAKEIDIPVPETVIIKNGTFKPNLLNNLKFPIFIKGKESNQWRNVYGGSKKGFLVNNESQLYNYLNEIIKNKVDIILQEFIEGPDTNHFKYNCYIDKKGILRAEFCLKKIRQNPIRFGVGSVVESIKNSQLAVLGRKLFRSINYRGIGSAEFKYDEKEKNYRLIEINPRYWQQNSLATACGINFPLIQYLDLTNQLNEYFFEYKEGVKWVNIYSDFDSYLSYRNEGNITFLQWLKSLRGEKIYSDWAFDDIKPGFYEIRFGKRLLNILPYLIKKFT